MTGRKNTGRLIVIRQKKCIDILSELGEGAHVPSGAREPDGSTRRRDRQLRPPHYHISTVSV